MQSKQTHRVYAETLIAEWIKEKLQANALQHYQADANSVLEPSQQLTQADVEAIRQEIEGIARQLRGKEPGK